MSTRFLVSLAAAVAVVLGARFRFASLPLRRLARPIAGTDVVLAGVGVVGLAFHCGAMFFRRLLEPLPGTGAAIGEIRALGTASIVWYLVPAVLLVIGLRRLHLVAPAVAAFALAAVGITMYDGGSVQIHLAAVFVAVVVLVGVAATLVLPPRRRRGRGVRLPVRLPG